MKPLSDDQIRDLLAKRVPQYEADGRKVAKFCSGHPRTISEIQHKLGDVSWGRARTAINWCKRERLTSTNPFLCIHDQDNRWRYGFREDFEDVSSFLLREVRYALSRLTGDEATIEHALITTASLAEHLGPADRATLNRWRKVLIAQAVAAEAIAEELVEMLA